MSQHFKTSYTIKSGLTTFLTGIDLQQKSQPTTTENYMFATISNWLSTTFLLQNHVQQKTPTISTKGTNPYKKKTLCFQHFENHVNIVEKSGGTHKLAARYPENLATTVMRVRNNIDKSLSQF